MTPRMLTPNARLYIRLIRLDAGLWLLLKLVVREVFSR